MRAAACILLLSVTANAEAPHDPPPAEAVMPPPWSASAVLRSQMMMWSEEAAAERPTDLPAQGPGCVVYGTRAMVCDYRRADPNNWTRGPE